MQKIIKQSIAFRKSKSVGAHVKIIPSMSKTEGAATNVIWILFE